MNEDMSSVTENDILESFKVYCLTLDKPKGSDKEEIRYTLELAKKQIKWLQQLLHKPLAGAHCVADRIDNAIKLLEKM